MPEGYTVDDFVASWAAAAAEARRAAAGTPVLFGRRASASAADVREAIVSIYAEHNPQRLGTVDRLLEQHAGGEAELLSKIVAKYTGTTKPPRAGAMAPRSRGREQRPEWVSVGDAPPPRGAALPPRGAAPQGGALPAVAVLPADVLQLCLRLLPSGTDLGRCACVCRFWRTAAQDDVLWKPLYLATWPPAEDGEGEGDELSVTPRRRGPWRHSFRVRWCRQCEGRLCQYVDRMARVGMLTQRHAADGTAGCFDPAPTFGSLRKIIDGLGLSFELRVNGGGWHAARALTNNAQRDRRGDTETRGLSCSLRCPAAALRRLGTVGELDTVEIIAHSELLHRRFPVCTAQCRRQPTALEARRGNTPPPSSLWRVVCDDAAKLYELPCGGPSDGAREHSDAAASFSSSITLVAFEEPDTAPKRQPPLGGEVAGRSVLVPGEGLGAMYCHVNHADGAPPSPTFPFQPSTLPVTKHARLEADFGVWSLRSHQPGPSAPRRAHGPRSAAPSEPLRRTHRRRHDLVPRASSGRPRQPTRPPRLRGWCDAALVRQDALGRFLRGCGR